MRLSVNEFSENPGFRRLATRHDRRQGNELCRRMGPLFQAMSAGRLIMENIAHIGGAGDSKNKHGCAFQPAFRDLETGCVALARFKDGSPAPMHLLDGLPSAWVLERDAAGRAVTIKSSVVAGFLRQGRFYTREQATAIAAELE